MPKRQLCTWSRYVTKALYRTLWRCLDTSYMPLYSSKPQTREGSNATCTPKLCISQRSPALWCYWCQTWKARWLPEGTYSSKLESGLGEGDEAFCGKQIMVMINIAKSWTHKFAKLIRVLMYLKILATRVEAFINRKKIERCQFSITFIRKMYFIQYKKMHWFGVDYNFNWTVSLDNF